MPDCQKAPLQPIGRKAGCGGSLVMWGVLQAVERAVGIAGIVTTLERLDSGETWQPKSCQIRVECFSQY